MEHTGHSERVNTADHHPPQASTIIHPSTSERGDRPHSGKAAGPLTLSASRQSIRLSQPTDLPLDKEESVRMMNYYYYCYY